MAMHHRLGQNSPWAQLDPALVGMVWSLLQEAECSSRELMDAERDARNPKWYMDEEAS